MFKKILKTIGLCLIGIQFSACEPEFAGNKPVNLKLINGPFQMRFAGINAKDYLVVLNTNYRFRTKTGTIQFYDITADPTVPVLDESLTIEIPNNTYDFYIDGNTILYILDRANNRILLYDFNGSEFDIRETTPGVLFEIKVSENPQNIVYFERFAGGAGTLAITSQLGGTIHFIDISDPSAPKVVTSGATEPAGVTIDKLLFEGVVGARLRAVPRQTVAGIDDNLDLSVNSATGRGANGAVYLGTSDDLIVTASYFANIIFGFRFESFINNANYAWDLEGFTNGDTVGGFDLEATEQQGFRGIDRDQAGNVYLSSRSDDAIYMLTTADLNIDKDPDDRNTRGFDQNKNTATEKKIVDVDTNRTDETIPSIGHLINNCPLEAAVAPIALGACGGTATKLWTIGLGTQRVYQVDPAGGGINATSPEGILGELPQRLLWHPDSNILYVANTRGDETDTGDSITILGADTLVKVGELVNP